MSMLTPLPEASSQAGVLASRTSGSAVETVLKRPRLRLNGLEGSATERTKKT